MPYAWFLAAGLPEGSHVTPLVLRFKQLLSSLTANTQIPPVICDQPCGVTQGWDPRPVIQSTLSTSGVPYLCPRRAHRRSKAFMCHCSSSVWRGSNVTKTIFTASYHNVLSSDSRRAHRNNPMVDLIMLWRAWLHYKKYSLKSSVKGLNTCWMLIILWLI